MRGLKVSRGIYLAEEVLAEAGIADEVEVEILDQLIKITPIDQNKKKNTLIKESPVWDQIRMENPDE